MADDKDGAKPDAPSDASEAARPEAAQQEPAQPDASRSDEARPRRRRVIRVEPQREAAADAASAEAEATGARAGAPKARRVEASAPDGALTPQDAPPPPEPGEEAAREAAEIVRARRRTLGFWTKALLWSFGLILSLSLAFSIERMIAELLTTFPWAAPVMGALVGVFVAAAIVLVLREIIALARLRHLEDLRLRALAARESARAGDPDAPKAAIRVAGDLERLYRERKDMAWSWARLKDRADDAVDADARLALYEREVMGPLDDEARVVIRRAAQRVATATAIMPSVLLDALAALVINLGMIRRMAEIYGGRAGFWGVMRLARRVVEHAMAVGLIALGDDLLEPLLGGGVASRISRRVGEGVINGAMTARIGLAAMEICRPLAFDALAKPKLRDVAWDAVSRVR